MIGRGEIAYAATVAHNSHAKMPPWIDLQDVIHDALEGLCDAATRYDPTQGVPLAQYASRRIQGAIWDGQRRMDHLTRHDRLHDVDDPGTPVALGDWDAATVADHADQVVERADLRRAVRRLPARLRYIVWEIHWNGSYMRQVGERLGVTESRVSQLHRQAIAQLRDHLEAP